MPVRLKKLIGTFLIVVLVIIYALAATTVATYRLGRVPLVGPSALLPDQWPGLGHPCNVHHSLDGGAQTQKDERFQLAIR